jgi:toxin ParE1/3/4
VSASLLWTPRAQEDLLEIYYFIGLDNPSAADHVFEAVQRRLEALAAHPRIGVRRPDIHPSTRMLVEGPYLILY